MNQPYSFCWQFEWDWHYRLFIYQIFNIYIISQNITEKCFFNPLTCIKWHIISIICWDIVVHDKFVEKAKCKTKCNASKVTTVVVITLSLNNDKQYSYNTFCLLWNRFAIIGRLVFLDNHFLLSIFLWG